MEISWGEHEESEGERWKDRDWGTEKETMRKPVRGKEKGRERTRLRNRGHIGRRRTWEGGDREGGRVEEKEREEVREKG